MQAVAKVKNVRYGVRKLRRVVDLVRGKSVAEAFAMLSILHTQTKGAPLVENALKSAVANFKQKSAAPVTAEELVVKTITADGGTIMKRIHPRSQGRAFRIEKPLSHITVVVANHVFGHINRDELLAVIDGESKSDHIRDDCGTTGPGLDRLLLVGAGHRLGFA